MIDERDLVAELRKAATEIAGEGHNGWGNLCVEAAEELERVRARARAVCPPQYGLSSPALDLVRELAQSCTPTKSAP